MGDTGQRNGGVARRGDTSRGRGSGLERERVGCENGQAEQSDQCVVEEVAGVHAGMPGVHSVPIPLRSAVVVHLGAVSGARAPALGAVSGARAPAHGTGGAAMRPLAAGGYVLVVVGDDRVTAQRRRQQHQGGQLPDDDGDNRRPARGANGIHVTCPSAHGASHSDIPEPGPWCRHPRRRRVVSRRMRAGRVVCAPPIPARGAFWSPDWRTASRLQEDGVDHRDEPDGQPEAEGQRERRRDEVTQ